MKKISHNKIIIVSVILVLIVSLAACGGKTDEKAKTDAPKTSVTVNKDKDKVEDKDTDKAKEESDKAKEDADVDTEPKPANKPATQPTNKPTEKSSGHTHSWKKHTVTEQVWVSNIVPVYKTQRVQVGTKQVSDGVFWHCNCGAEIPMSESDDHVFAHIEADEPDNGYTVEHFHKEPVYKTKQVQVGTRDDGHYETKTRVDYYCDCGAKK